MAAHLLQGGLFAFSHFICAMAISDRRNAVVRTTEALLYASCS